MAQPKLGLPFEYKYLPGYFDMWNICDDTAAKNSVIEKILQRHKVEKVLDFTCGTGSQVFFLTKYGYKVTGVDFSPNLLQQARKKALEQKLNIKFINGDMRTLKVGSFDAVITIFNAIGHITRAGFEKAMRNVNKNLKNGGLYVFDILNLQAMTDEVVSNLAETVDKPFDGGHFHKVQYSTIDRENALLTSHDSCTIQRDSNKAKIFNSKFTLQIYTAEELEKMLSLNGFEVINQYGLDGSEFIADKSLSILTVARKLP